MTADVGTVAETAGEESTSDVEVDVRGVTKEFRARRGSTLALSDINLSIKREEFISLIGRSGCGKTTLLRTLAGLNPPSSGTVLVSGSELWRGGRVNAEAVSKFGVVFQDANLFPWYDVRDNIALPLALRGVGKRERYDRAVELAELVGLTGFESSYPRELSGGMRQRVAIARALSFRPEMLLMDEPFGALDAMTRERMNLELQRIVLASKATCVFVTHDITEAVFLADRVVHLTPRPGRVRSITQVPIDRPRDMDTHTDAAFTAIVRDLRHALDEEH